LWKYLVLLQPLLDNMTSKKQMLRALVQHNIIFINSSLDSAVKNNLPSKSPELHYF